MNTIGKMGKGQWAYYEEQIERGRDDYYSAGANRPGRWQGRGAAVFGLGGEVARRDVARLFTGRHPRTEDDRTLINDPRWKIPGYDLTFSSPKSLSVLWSLADAGIRNQIDEALDRANDAMLGWLEDKIAYGRIRGPDGEPVTVRATGLTVATYAHNVSRNLDPHLHRHNLVHNAVQRPNPAGELTFGALDGRRLYAYARPAGFLGQRLLRQELTHTLGVRWSKELTLRGKPVDAAPGVKEIVGLHDREVVIAYSTRQQDIREHMEALGFEGATANEKAKLKTRQRKPDRVPPEALEERWRSTAERSGISAATARAAMGAPVALRPPTEVDVEQAFEWLLAPDGLTRSQSNFNFRDVVMALCEAFPDEIELTPELVDQLGRRFLDERAIYLGLAGENAKLRSGDVIRVGTAARAVGADRERYTTPEMLATETAGLLAALSAPPRPAAAPALLERVLQERERHGVSLLKEQAGALRGLAGSGRRVQTLLGEAGTGKTTVISALRQVRQSEGGTVFGLALSARAVQQLHQARIPHRGLRTIASWHAWLAAGSPIPPGATVVVDEAGMVGTRDLIRIQDAVLAAGGELILVGDDEQLCEIDAGGYFRGLHRRLCEQDPDCRASHELHQVLRQRDPLDVEALRALRGGDVREALANLDRRGLIFEGEDATAAERAMIQDWVTLRGSGRQVLMLARSRYRVATLNMLAQAVRHQAGELGDDTVPIAGGQSLRVGDDVRFRKRHWPLGLINGTEGVVTKLDPARGRALVRYRDRVDREREAWLGPEWLRAERRDGTEYVQLNYASTGTVAQGATTDIGLVFASDDADKQWAYVVLSRHTQQVRLYAVAEPGWLEEAREVMHGPIAGPEPAERLQLVAAAMQRDTRKELATDITETEDAAEEAEPPGATTETRRAARLRELLVMRDRGEPLGLRQLRELSALMQANQKERRAREGAVTDMPEDAARQHVRPERMDPGRCR